MQSQEECLLMYRQRLRELLFWAGQPSNPGVTDDWVLEQVSRVFAGYMVKSGQFPMTLENIPAGILGFLAKKHGWEIETTRQKISRAQEILGLSVVGAVSFLMEVYIPAERQVICDGCRVALPHEHRCHGRLARVGGEPSGPCQCVECFVGNHLL